MVEKPGSRRLWPSLMPVLPTPHASRMGGQWAGYSCPVGGPHPPGRHDATALAVCRVEQQERSESRIPYFVGAEARRRSHPARVDLVAGVSLTLNCWCR